MVIDACRILGAWNLYKQSRVDWARGEALPEISRLLAEDKGLAAFDLAQQVGALIPDDRDFQQAWAEAGPKPLGADRSAMGPRSTLRELGIGRSPGVTWAPRRSRICPCRVVTSSGRSSNQASPRRPGRPPPGGQW